LLTLYELIDGLILKAFGTRCMKGVLTMPVIPPIGGGGGEWSWWIPVIFLAVCAFFAIVGMARNRLERYPWWHTALVLVATILSATFLTSRDRHIAYSGGGFVIFVFMLVPSGAAIALIYNIAMSFIESKRRNKRG
jgi:hypothetical protein